MGRRGYGGGGRHIVLILKTTLSQVFVGWGEKRKGFMCQFCFVLFFEETVKFAEGFQCEQLSFSDHLFLKLYNCLYKSSKFLFHCCCF